jgi:hypothetical protein
MLINICHPPAGRNISAEHENAMKKLLLRTRTTYIWSTMMRMTEQYVVIRLVNNIQMDGKDLFQSI